MRFIPTKIHGFLDYAMGIILITAPWTFGFYTDGPDTYIPVVLGILAIVYSLFTNYELGVVSMFSMPMHLMFDLASGILLAASPWLFGFSEHVYMPHLILGIVEIGAALFTKKVPGTNYNRARETSHA